MKPVQFYCVWCGDLFAWYPSGPNDKANPKRYCNPHCKAQARRAHREFKRNFRPGYCPTPDKKAYHDDREASRTIAENPTRTEGVRAYLCSCGYFHLGRFDREVWLVRTAMEGAS